MKKAPLLPIFLVYFIDNFAFAIVLPLFASLVIQPEMTLLSQTVSLKARNFLLGCLIASFPFAQLFGAPLFGDLADQIGRKRTFYLTISGLIVGNFLTGIAIAWHQFHFLLFSRLITGFFSGNLSICLAALADRSPDVKTRSKNYGLLAAVNGLSWVLAILVGGELSDPKVSSLFSPSLPFWIGTALSILNLITVKLFFYDTKREHPMKKAHFLRGVENISEAFHLKKTRLLFGLFFFWMMGWAVSLQWLSAYSLENFKMGRQVVTGALLIAGLLWIFGSSLLNRILIRYLSIQALMFSTLFILGALLLSCSLAPQFSFFLVVYSIGAAAASLLWTNNLNLISVNSPPTVQGKMMGFSQSVISFSQLVAPLLGGLVAFNQINFLYLFAAIIVFAAFLWFWMMKSLIHRNQPKRSNKCL